eukprot:scaffold27397_cov77-Phaeocystis_antarctica.AAC.4
MFRWFELPNLPVITGGGGARQCGQLARGNWCRGRPGERLRLCGSYVRPRCPAEPSEACVSKLLLTAEERALAASTTRLREQGLSYTSWFAASWVPRFGTLSNIVICNTRIYLLTLR